MVITILGIIALWAAGCGLLTVAYSGSPWFQENIFRRALKFSCWLGALVLFFMALGINLIAVDESALLAFFATVIVITIIFGAMMRFGAGLMIGLGFSGFFVAAMASTSFERQSTGYWICALAGITWILFFVSKSWNSVWEQR